MLEKRIHFLAFRKRRSFWKEKRVVFLDIGGETLTMESLDGLLRNFRSGENVLKNEVLQKQGQIGESLQGDSTPFSLRECDIVDEIYFRLRCTLDSILEPPYFNLTDQSLIIVTSEIETQLLLFFANTDLSQIPVDFSFSRAKIQIVKRANGTIEHGEWNQRPGAISFF